MRSPGWVATTRRGLLAGLVDGVLFDQEWLLGMSLLAETAVALDDPAAATAIYEAMLPWAHLNAGDHPEGIRGAVARYLGLLAPSAQAAEAHFEAAPEMNARMG